LVWKHRICYCFIYHFCYWFCNYRKDIGNETVPDKNHPSIIEINKNKKDIPNLEFKEISDEFVHKQINKTSGKKATGRDGISVKLLKLAKPVIAKILLPCFDHL
jgi:hypothetical protein